MMTRRDMLSLAALGLAGKAKAQPRRPTIQVQRLNHLTLMVSDIRRSREFYQGLFGMPVQSHQGPAVGLRIGAGPQFLFLAQTPKDRPPAINHFCMTVERFRVDQVLTTLAEHGVARTEGGGLAGGPMKSRVRMRGPADGGAKDGTPELYFGDPDGITVQLQDAAYCGGAGARGEICPQPEPSTKKGLLALRDLSHFTLAVSNRERSFAFYQDLFGMRVQTHQGPGSALLAVGSGPQFLALAGTSLTGGSPGIAHACLTMEGFNPREGADGARRDGH